MAEVSMEAFAPAELAAWLERSRAAYLAERVAAGDSPAEAAAEATTSGERTFPGGRPAAGHLAGWVVHEGRRVGILWVGPQGDDLRRWWVWDIEIDEAERGRGLGRAAMVLAEELARRAGAETIGLNVFASNRVARGLYGSLGYQETAVQMRKPLAPRSGS